MSSPFDGTQPFYARSGCSETHTVSPAVWTLSHILSLRLLPTLALSNVSTKSFTFERDGGEMSVPVKQSIVFGGGRGGGGEGGI